MPVDPIDDDELVYRRVPPVTPWFEPPDQVSTANFKLDQRHGELGLSVYRASVVSPQDVLAKSDAIPGSQISTTDLSSSIPPPQLPSESHIINIHGCFRTLRATRSELNVALSDFDWQY